MDLDAYLRERRISTTQFAKLTGVLTKQTVHHYRYGLRFPSAESMRVIREATEGAVTPNDFVEQHAGPSALIPKSKTKRLRTASPDASSAEKAMRP